MFDDQIRILYSVSCTQRSDMYSFFMFKHNYCGQANDSVIVYYYTLFRILTSPAQLYLTNPKLKRFASFSWKS